MASSWKTIWKSHQKKKNYFRTLEIWSRDFTSRHLSKDWKQVSMRFLATFAHSFTIHNSEKVKATQIPISRWINKCDIHTLCSFIQPHKGKKSYHMVQHAWLKNIMLRERSQPEGKVPHDSTCTRYQKSSNSLTGGGGIVVTKGKKDGGKRSF